MQVILLSGGSVKRLWSLSNEVRLKQFIKIFNETGGKSMLQRVLDQIRRTCPKSLVTIATAKKQITLLKKYLGESFNFAIEPCR